MLDWVGVVLCLVMWGQMLGLQLVRAKNLLKPEFRSPGSAFRASSLSPPTLLPLEDEASSGVTLEPVLHDLHLLCCMPVFDLYLF